MWWFFWLLIFWSLYVLSILQSFWLQLKQTLIFQRESSAPMCVHPASEWCASQPAVRGSRVKTKATGFQHAYSALNTRATLAGRSVCRTVGSSHRQHPTVSWMLVHTWGCVVWQRMRADLLRTIWQLLTLCYWSSSAEQWILSSGTKFLNYVCLISFVILIISLKAEDTGLSESFSDNFAFQFKMSCHLLWSVLQNEERERAKTTGLSKKLLLNFIEKKTFLFCSEALLGWMGTLSQSQIGAIQGSSLCELRVTVRSWTHGWYWSGGEVCLFSYKYCMVLRFRAK